MFFFLISVTKKPPAPSGKLNQFQVCLDLKYFLFEREGREGGNKLSIDELTPARAGKIFLVFRKCSLVRRTNGWPLAWNVNHDHVATAAAKFTSSIQESLSLLSLLSWYFRCRSNILLFL